MLVPPPPGDGAGSLASGAGSSAAAATDAADAAGLAASQGKKIPCPIRPPVIFTDHEINPNAESFAAFQIEMTSPGFQEELEKARDNPKSIKEAGNLIQRLKRFITTSAGVKIPSPECDAFNEADLYLPHLGLA